MMEHKGYVGKVEFDDEAGIFHGEVVNTRDVITFQGSTAQELKDAFRSSVEDYLAFCAERGEEPEKPYSGQFVTRITPDLHRKVSIVATYAGKSLNAWVAEQLDKCVRVVLPNVQATRVRKPAGAKRKARPASRKPLEARKHS